MLLRTGIWTLFALALSSPLTAQEATGRPANEPTPRQFTLTAGVGNATGWLGVQGEGYFLGGRLSAFGGMGVTKPGTTEAYPSGLTVAVGLRGFTSGTEHRGFLEVSVSQIAIAETVAIPGNYTVDGERLYGPGLQVGYQFTDGGGFTFMASTGAGYGIGRHEYSGSFHRMIGVGLGYTWR